MVVTREAEWDDSSRAWAVSLLELEARACPGCGADMAETTDAVNEFAYEATAPVRCHKCTSIASKSAEYHDLKAPHPHALHYPVKFHRPAGVSGDLSRAG